MENLGTELLGELSVEITGYGGPQNVRVASNEFWLWI